MNANPPRLCLGKDTCSFIVQCSRKVISLRALSSYIIKSLNTKSQSNPHLSYLTQTHHDGARSKRHIPAELAPAGFARNTVGVDGTPVRPIVPFRSFPPLSLRIGNRLPEAPPPRVVPLATTPVGTTEPPVLVGITRLGRFRCNNARSLRDGCFGRSARAIRRTGDRYARDDGVVMWSGKLSCRIRRAGDGSTGGKGCPE